MVRRRTRARKKRTVYPALAAAPAKRSGAWLMLVLATSFKARRRIGQRRWRQLHYASFAAFSLALWHGLTTGSDLVGMRGLVFAAVALTPILWLTFLRILTPRPAPKPRRAPAPPPAAAADEPARPTPVAV